MYIAMNRFRVVPGFEEAFENQWKAREGRLAEMPGYIEFHMLKGPKADDHTLYASHTVWATHADFVAWTKSEQFQCSACARRRKQGAVSLGPAFRGLRRHHSRRSLGQALGAGSRVRN